VHLLSVVTIRALLLHLVPYYCCLPPRRFALPAFCSFVILFAHARLSLPSPTVCAFTLRCYGSHGFVLHLFLHPTSLRTFCCVVTFAACCGLRSTRLVTVPPFTLPGLRWTHTFFLLRTFALCDVNCGVTFAFVPALLSARLPAVIHAFYRTPPFATPVRVCCTRYVTVRARLPVALRSFGFSLPTFVYG